MDWTRAIDAYCERLDPGFWAEPVNALTNLAFVLAAAVMWPRVRGLGRVMCAVLAGIGLGSFLFHTLATAWAAAADTTPITAFILIYLFAANRDFWGLPPWVAAVGALAFLPASALATPWLAHVPVLGVSAPYLPVPILILAYAAGLRRRAPETARGLAIGAALLLLSLTFRSLDQWLCAALPLGTHFLWHLLNALMLGWMIEVWRRHTLAETRPRR